MLYTMNDGICVEFVMMLMVYQKEKNRTKEKLL